ncbi:uncharacterized protein LOC119390045 isoform X1 [Rhipicephalus sanguineus]|uniref:uncharacterized protein LOC119390045 isoform X1 n=1 Tax=Rhipicephalus sanguineus TaxID=34632 RepID=UPI00189565C0|nr:uncharacterized protein LOC119390045 isoform X1 [Rhipicephalus sanguineus]
MRFFKRRSPEPPELVRLCRLPPEEAFHHHSHNVGRVEGGQPAAFAMTAPLVHRAAVSRSASPTATLVRLRQQRRGECFCGSAKEAMALSSETRGAGGPVDVVSSTVPRCCFVEATGAARTATPPGSAKLKRAGFAFSRVGRKTCVGPHKYSLPPTPISLSDERPSLVEWPQRLATFAQPLRLPVTDLLSSREASRSVECLQDRRDGGFYQECTQNATPRQQRSPHERSLGPVVRKTSSRMYRSRSTSALVIEASLHDADVMDHDELDTAVLAVAHSGGRYSRDCFDEAAVIDGVSGCKDLPCSEEAGSTSSGSSTTSGGGPPTPPLEEDVGAHGAGDTASLASSTQHRSDESGYESDGTKNGGEDSPNEEALATATAAAAGTAPAPHYQQHAQRRMTQANGTVQSPRIVGTEPASHPLKTDVTSTTPRSASAAAATTATTTTPSTAPSQRRASSQEGSNVQRIAAALLHRISLQSPSSAFKDSRQDKSRLESSKQDHNVTPYDCKSLRCKTQSLFSVLRWGDNSQNATTPNNSSNTSSSSCGSREAPESSPRSERSTPTNTGSSKLEQFRAWTLDRKLLRNRWKKSSSTSSEGRSCTSFESPVLSRAGSQEPPSHDVVDNAHLQATALKSASSWTSVCVGNNDVAKDSAKECRLGRASLGDLGCRSVGDVSGAGDLGPRTSSSNDLRRRLWLEAHLEGVSTRQHRVSDASVRSAPDGARVLAVRLAKDSRGELGVYIKGKCAPDGTVLGYVVADLEQDGPAARSGQLRKGDELLVINGHQVQGVEIEEARQLLATPDQVVHLLVARQEEGEEDYSEVPLASSPNGTSRLAEPHRAPAERRASISHPGAAANYNTIPEVSEEGEKESQATQQYSSGVLCTLPRRPRHRDTGSVGSASGVSSSSELLTVTFVKGPGRGALGFSVVGGRDSPRGALGIYVRRIFPGGQAEGLLREGDQLLSLNGEPFEGLSHAEAIAAFKRVRQGELVLRVARRPPKNSQVSKSCCNLDSMT